MFSTTSFDKTLINLINIASLALAGSMVLFTFYTLVDLPDATNGQWGVGTIGQQVADHYSRGWSRVRF